MPKKKKAKSKTAMYIRKITTGAFLILLGTFGLEKLLGWNWITWVTGGLTITTGLWFILLSGFNLLKPLSSIQRLKLWKGMVNIVNLVLGGALIWVGLATFFDVFSIPVLAIITAWAYFITGIVGIAQIIATK